MVMANIQEYHLDLHQQTLAKIEDIRSCVPKNPPIESYVYFWLLANIKNTIFEQLSHSGVDIVSDDITLKSIDRKSFGADVSFVIQSMVKKYWSEYIAKFVPMLLESLKDTNNWYAVHIKDIKQVGIYTNILLKDIFLQDAVDIIGKLWSTYGKTNKQSWDVVIAEFSSPNAAKHLHAWHIRSTVVWQVLANMYKEVGSEVHTINHINDRWWFGEIIQWYACRRHLLKDSYKWNDLSFAIYSIYRSAEKLYNAIKLGNDINKEDLETMKQYFDFSTDQEFMIAYELYKNKSQDSFRKLESGSGKEFEVWKEIYANSMEEFNTFYEKLWITHDYIIGESFYEKIGKEVIQEWLDRWIIVYFTQAEAEKYFADYLAKNPDVGSKIIENKKKEIFEDVWSYVALLDNFERYVVLRSDGASIYATRDLWCIYYRSNYWNPTTITYEVWQEQADHFNKLFETARKFGRDKMDNGKLREYLHISHGFYVNNKTRKKLSSREWASNVMNLISSAEQHFKDKYSEHTSNFDESEIDHIAKILGKTSILINDIKRGRMSPVLVDEDIKTTLEDFEKAGGAYLMYTLCRAKSVLSKSNAVDRVNTSEEFWLEVLQADLIKLMLQYPRIIQRAVELHEPSVIVEYIYELTSGYNTLYNDRSQGKIAENHTNQMITKWFVTIIENAFRVFHIDALERM